MKLARKARIIRSQRGAIADICRATGKSHTLVSLALDAKLPDMKATWLEPVLAAIDEKVAEILEASNAA